MEQTLFCFLLFLIALKVSVFVSIYYGMKVNLELVIYLFWNFSSYLRDTDH